MGESDTRQIALGEMMPWRKGDAPSRFQLIAAGAFMTLALLSVLVLRGVFTSPATYSKTIESLDAKKQTVMALSAASVGASTALTLLPGDVATPHADRLSELSRLFIVVLAAILLEKYLLTTLGFAATTILIPLGCFFGVGMLFADEESGLKDALRGLMAKMMLLALVLLCTVPASVWISSNIEATYQESIDIAIESAEITAQAAEDTAEEIEENEATNPLEFFQQQIGNLQKAAGNAITTVGDTVAGVPQLIGNFIESIAVMLVLTCGVPMLVLAFFLWVVKILLGVEIRIPGRRFALPAPDKLPEGRDSAAS